MRQFIVAVSSTLVNKAEVRYWTGQKWAKNKRYAKRYAHACNAKGTITRQGFKDDLHTRHFVTV
jgi:hypothetical protein